MPKFARLSPPYSQVIVRDEARGDEIPILTGDVTIKSSHTAITIACLAEMDGETSFTLGLIDEVNPGVDPAFEGVVYTPRRRLAISTVEGALVLEIGVESVETDVVVWVNSTREPDEIIIGVRS
jgi:hypothetical protein